MVRVLLREEQHLLDNNPAHAMPNHHYRRIPARSSEAWGVLHVPQQSLSKIVDCDLIAFSFTPIGAVPEAVYANMFELWLPRKPLFRPEVARVCSLAPRLSRTTSEAMHKDEIDQGFRGFVEETEP